MTITTKLLAIGTRTAQGTPDAIGPTLPYEVRATVQLYLDGKIDQWFVKQDRSGVVFLLRGTDADQATAMLADLPLVVAGMMTFEVIPLAPLSPLSLLLSETSL